MGTLLPKIFSTLLKLLKAFKGFKLGMAAVTFGGYAWMFSWQFALLLMGSIFLHELGHIRAMKAYGMKTRGVNFLPFMGAAAVTEEDFPSRKAEAVIAIWGPLWGLMLSMIFFDIYAWTDSPLMAGVAAWCAMVNLFNLLPIKPLDGGRIVSSLIFSISERLGMIFMALGILVAFALLVITKVGLLAIILVVAALELRREWMNKYPDVQGLRYDLLKYAEETPEGKAMMYCARMMQTQKMVSEADRLANEAFVSLIIAANEMKWKKLSRYVQPDILVSCLQSHGGYAVFQQIMAGKLEVPEDAKRRPMSALSAAGVFFTAAVVLSMLLLIVRVASIDPASQAALNGFIH